MRGTDEAELHTNGNTRRRKGTRKKGSQKREKKKTKVDKNDNKKGKEK